jgi:hypothetical protein
MRLVLVLLAGCSFATVTPAPKEPVSSQCTTSQGAPVLDAIVAGTSILIAASLISGDDDSGAAEDESFGAPDINLAGPAASVLIVTGVATAISALYGFSEVSRCNDQRPLPPLPP